MSTGTIKRVIKAKIKANKDLTEEEQVREKMKYEIAEELGLADKVKREGWGGLSSGETGRIGGIMARRNKKK